MFQAWAEDGGPPTATDPKLLPSIASDPMAPPALRHVASREGVTDPPKLTRASSAYLRYISEGPGASPAMPSGAAALNVPDALGGGMPSSLGPPSVGASRQVSDNPMPQLGRSVSSFVRDFIDESATLMDAPPASAVPPSNAALMPPLRAGASFSELADLPGMGDIPGLSRQDSLGRRASPRLGSPRR